MESPSSLLSPSHTPTSSEKLADVAARVLRELRLSHHHHHHDENFPFEELDDFYSSSLDDLTNDAIDDVTNDKEEEEDGGGDSEFEFCNPSGDHNSTSPVSADDIFSNGQIKPTYYPLFDTSLLRHYDAVSATKHPQRFPLRKLMTEESAVTAAAAAAASCSSSEVDDLDGVPHETYCVWVPHDGNSKNSNNNVDDVDTMKKKSKSTGSSNNSKRWRIRDLVHYHRSNSDGKDKFVFLTHPPRLGGGAHRNGGGGGGEVNNGKQPIPADKKKKTYLPYRQDLVGFFSTPTGLNRTVRPF